jgi:two-component system, NarL family, sensor histidine kinase YdfH
MTERGGESHAPAQRAPHAWLLFVALGVLYLLIRLDLPSPRQQTVFSALMLAHTAVYLAWLYAPPKWLGRWTALLFITQGLLIGVLVATTNSSTASFGLCIMLGVLAASQVKRGWQALILAVATLALHVAFAALLTTTATLPEDLLAYLGLAAPIFGSVLVFKRETQARRRAQRLVGELATAQRQLAASAAQVEQLTRAAERQRLARDLHDTLAQGLAGVILQLEAADAHHDAGNTERAHVITQQAAKRARATLHESRRAIDDLRREASPDDWTIQIRDELDAFTASTSIDCALELGLQDVSVPEPIVEQVLRSLRELLTNVARHAHATAVRVVVEVTATRISLEVRDNGIGFDPGIAPHLPGHYGLRGLRERAELTGGVLRLGSASGQGTTITLCLPLAPVGAAR